MLSVLAWLPFVKCKHRFQATGIGTCGIALILLIQATHGNFAHVTDRLNDWAPGLWILLVYWQSGRFYTRSNRRLQEMLQACDGNINAFLKAWAHRWTQTWLGSFLELAYLLCYPLLPMGVAVLYAAHAGAKVDQYWMLILVSTYVCYLVLPFAQTLPPRKRDPELIPDANVSRVRRMNLWVLRHASIQVNTFPSAHVASAVAASLALARMVPPVGAVFLFVSGCIAFAAVVGRYHYLLDVLAGAAIPLLLFVLWCAHG